MTPEMKALRGIILAKIEDQRDMLEKQIANEQSQFHRGTIFGLRAVLDAIEPKKPAPAPAQDAAPHPYDT